MRSSSILAIAAISAGVLLAGGCSTSGGTFSLFPTGHYLTDQTRQVLENSPRIAALPRELDKTVLPAIYLEPGDGLLVEVVDLASEVRLPADQQILADGTIDLGLYGRVIVAGLTLEQAERLIEDQLVAFGEDDDERVNVRLLEPQAVYYVLGEVSSPGAYPLVGRETVLDGIVAAGGLTSRASPCDILLARPTLPQSCRVTLPVCYRQITQLGDTTTNYQLQPGDRIYVGTRTFCEDIAFWRADKTCQYCQCRPQVPCPDPSIAAYRNPITVLPAHPEQPPAVTEGVAPLPPGRSATSMSDRSSLQEVRVRSLQPPSPAVGLIE